MPDGRDDAAVVADAVARAGSPTVGTQTGAVRLGSLVGVIGYGEIPDVLLADVPEFRPLYERLFAERP